MASIKPSWSDPRGFFTKTQPDPSKWENNPYTSPEAMVHHFQKQMRELQDSMSELANEMMNLKGFYGWLIHAYPETIAQYKAIQELQRASEVGTATAEEKVPMYAVGKQP